MRTAVPLLFRRGIEVLIFGMTLATLYLLVTLGLSAESDERDEGSYRVCNDSRLRIVLLSKVIWERDCSAMCDAGATQVRQKTLYGNKSNPEAIEQPKTETNILYGALKWWSDSCDSSATIAAQNAESKMNTN